MAREFFCAYHSYLEWIENLSDAEKGRLFVACLQYSESGSEPVLPGSEKIIFPAIRRQIDRDKEAYEAKCNRLRENGSKGGQANASKSQANAKQKPSKCSQKGEGKRNISTCVDTPPNPLKEAIESFCDHRKKMRKPMTDYAIDLFRKRLQELAPSNEEKQIELINTAIERGWQTVYLPDEKKPSARKLTGSNAPYAQHKFSDADFEDILLDLNKVEV